MKIESQIVSLRLAKRLRELGYSVPAYCAWVYFEAIPKEELAAKWILEPNYTPSAFPFQYYWAPTAAELGERLPAEINFKGATWYLRISKEIDFGWLVYYEHEDGQETIEGGYAPSLSDSLVGMTLYLLENKLIEIK